VPVAVVISVYTPRKLEEIRLTGLGCAASGL